MYKTTLLYLVKLFPVGIKVRNSESTTHAYWNQTIKQKDDIGGGVLTVGAEGFRQVWGGGQSNPGSEELEREASV